METANQFTQTASQLYQVATNVAHRAGEAASTARDKLREWKHQEFRFNEWQKRMSNTHPEIWSLVFIVVCICEYYFSRELYRDFMPDAPLVPAIGMIFLTVLISHYLSTTLSSNIKEVEFFELSLIEEKKNLPDFERKAILNKDIRRHFIIGTILFIVVGAIVFFLSFDRVGREIAAGRRTKAFGMQDMLPVLFYLFEVLSGIFVVYLFKKYSLKARVARLFREKEGNINLCHQFTREVITRFQEAEQKGYIVSKDTVSEDIHKAYYRSKRKDRSEEEDYINDPALVRHTINLEMKRSDGTPLRGNVRIITEFNFSRAAASGQDGRVSFDIESYEGDSVKEVVFESFENNGGSCQEKYGPWDFGAQKTHVIYF